MAAVEEKVHVVSDVEMKTAEDTAAETARYEQFERLVQEAAAIEEQRSRRAQQTSVTNECETPTTPVDHLQNLSVYTDAVDSSALHQATHATPAVRPEETVHVNLTAQPAIEVDMDHDMTPKGANPHAMSTGFSPLCSSSPLNNAFHGLHGPSNTTTQQPSHSSSVSGQESYNNAICAIANLTHATSELHHNRINRSTNGALTESVKVKDESRADDQAGLGYLRDSSSAGNVPLSQQNGGKVAEGEEDKENLGGHQDVIVIDD